MSAVLSAALRAVFAITVAALFICNAADAQNTSSVSGPTVSAGDRSVEYRLGWIPREEGVGDNFAHRVDFGAALNERTAFKVFANFEDRPGANPRFDNINAEYLIELSPENAPVWQTGIRFDARLSNGPDPERIGFNWLNQWRLSDRLRARAQFIATRQFGETASRAVAFELRSSLIWQATEQYDISLLSFTNLGDSDDFGMDGQVQELGPTLSGDLPNGFGWTVGTLFGLTDEAPDQDFRFWVSKSF